MAAARMLYFFIWPATAVWRPFGRGEHTVESQTCAWPRLAAPVTYYLRQFLGARPRVEAEDLRRAPACSAGSTRSIGVYAQKRLKTARRGNSASHDSRKLLIRWRSLPDSNRCTSLGELRCVGCLHSLTESPSQPGSAAPCVRH